LSKSEEKKLGWSNLYAGEIHLVDIGQHLGDLVAVLKDRTCRLCEVIERRVTTQYLSQRSHGIHLLTHTCIAFTCSHTPVLHSPAHTRANHRWRKQPKSWWAYFSPTLPRYPSIPQLSPSLPFPPSLPSRPSPLNPARGPGGAP